MADQYGILRSVLSITFDTKMKDTFVLNIANPKDSITEAQIKEIASHVLDNQIFKNGGGTDEIIGLVKAKVTYTDTNKFDLEM